MRANDIRFVCISLVRAEARRRRMVEQFSRLGVKVEFFDALEPDPNEYQNASNYDAAFRARNHGRQLSRGEVGCYRSHMEVWRRLSIQGAAMACVIEDDVELNPNLVAQIDSILSGPNVWDVLRLAGVFERRLGRVVATLQDTREIVNFADPPRGTQAYLIRVAAAEILARYCEPIRYPIDDAIDRYWEHNLRIRSVRPWIASEDRSVPSTIDGRDREHVLVGVRVRRECRRILDDVRRLTAFSRSLFVEKKG